MLGPLCCLLAQRTVEAVLNEDLPKERIKALLDLALLIF
jgi:hypothetical protein